ncbi:MULTISPECIES: V-type ATP synthase subunit I [Enterococcus]|uniref:V-type ATP synthase subunit I n=1 Tax=Enterococcus alishanensis TaxID=1303817 RepID=A0ABS6T9G1_9ENTE|nr:V-type ATP synthase subunit I [Enterococcus alishanensis]MBV7389539.1 V-type ATP synthase subunit I [Enterococcus alishanensis]
MAVSKMKKLTLIAEDKKTHEILVTLQGFQGVEVRDVFDLKENNQWVKAFFTDFEPNDQQDQIQQIDQQIEAIHQSIKFIKDHGSSKEKAIHLKRRFLTLQQLEEQFDPEKLLTELTEIENLISRFAELNQREKTLTVEEEVFSKWQYLDVIPQQNNLKTSQTFLGTVETENWEKLKADLQQETIYFEEVYSDGKITNFSLIYLNQQQAVVKQLIAHFSITKFDYLESQLPKNKLAEIHSEQNDVYQAKQQLSTMIGQKRVNIHELEWAEETLLAQKNRLLVHKSYIQTDHLFVLQGWIAEDEVLSLEKRLATEEVYLSVEEPNLVEIETEIPTKLKNSRLVKPFEMLTEMYALPKYEEIDPTPWFTPFYLVFFGMMVADIGYGLLMLIATTIVLKSQILPNGTKRFMEFFQILSIPTIVWGLIYNGFFGFSLPYKPILSTSNDVITILILSIIFGLIQIFVGLGLAAAENIKAKNYLAAISQGFAWQGIFVGGIIAAAGKMLLTSSPIFILGIIIAGISALSIVVLPMVGSKSKLAALAGGAYDLYGITGYIGDLVSYTRLMALGISGGSIAAAFNMLVGYMPPVAKFSVGILLMLVLHGLNIFLSLLSAYVHGARLQYVEFFGKFYQGGGKPFKPLKTEEKYINIEKKDKLEEISK